MTERKMQFVLLSLQNHIGNLSFEVTCCSLLITHFHTFPNVHALLSLCTYMLLTAKRISARFYQVLQVSSKVVYISQVIRKKNDTAIIQCRKENMFLLNTFVTGSEKRGHFAQNANFYHFLNCHRAKAFRALGFPLALQTI